VAGIYHMGMRNSQHNFPGDDPIRLPFTSVKEADWTVMDFFSGCGGMSCGFARRKPFRLIAAVDAEHAKPCEGFGRLDCNDTYYANIGIRPFDRDIASLDPESFLSGLGDRIQPAIRRGELTVFLCCPPCTDFSRAKPTNYSVDTAKNSLVVGCANFVEAFLPEFVLMENSRELISGNHPHHYREFVKRLGDLGYDVRGGVHFLTKFGLPQIRERALIVASRVGPVRTLEDMWDGWQISRDATTVRHAIGHYNARRLSAGEADPDDRMHQSPGFASEVVRRRIQAIPADGGSWFDLADHPQRDELITNTMKDRIERRDLGSHPDVYGRLAWDRPSVTIKRECAHVGNGRYSHPEQDRLLTVREMAQLQGFPSDFVFVSKSLANRYRHIGDAVPPLISYQLSALVAWMKTGNRPQPSEWILPGTSLSTGDVFPRAIARF
jgi:DNA (cytosine-5)-methyltransferase 1